MEVLHKAVLDIPMESQKAAVVAESLGPEALGDTDVGFKVEASTEGLRLLFHAEDAAKLRAALNSYVRLAIVALDVTK